MEIRKGQVFIMSAIIFSSLALLAITSTQQTYTTTSGADVNTYFQSVLNHQSGAVDAALKENYSAESVRNELYTYDRFIERRSESKSLSYEAFQTVVIPKLDSAVVVNYRPRMVAYGIHGTSWNNDTLNPYQSSIMKVEGPKYRIYTEELGVDREFNASTPSILGRVEMESGESVLTDTVLR